MEKKRTYRLTIFLLVIALVTVMCAVSGGEAPTESVAPLTANLSEISGEVKVLKQLEGVFKDAVADTQIEEQDQVLTGEDGRVRMDLSNGTIIRLSPLSNFTLTSIEDTPEGPLTRLQLNIGRLWIILRGGVVEVDTPSGLASVRGSYLHVWVDPETDEAGVTCLEGECTLGNSGGTVALVAGQSAKIVGEFSPPVADAMTDEDVAEWIAGNPEATLVVIPLTQTVAAYQGQALPESKTNTPTMTPTVTTTPKDTSTPTITGTPADCGPQSGWVLHTVREGESLESIAALYRVEVSALQQANCRGDLTFVTTGEKLYVPNVATSTPTKTPTPTPSKTPTPIASSTPNYTLTVSAGGPTATPKNSATTFDGPVGPDNEVIDAVDGSECPNAYKITAKDENGITDVKMIWTYDGSLPMRDKAISKSYYKLLPLISTDRYGVSDYTIDTSGQSLPVNIRFRFAVLDDLGNVAYFPKDDAYDLTDKVNCPVGVTPTTLVDTPTVFNSFTGPSGTLSVCKQTYSVNVTDPDGIVEVKLLYSIDGNDPDYGTAVGLGNYYLMGDQGGGTYEAADEVINTDGNVGTDTVKYRFSVKDGLGNIKQSTVYSYNDNLECGETTWTFYATPQPALSSPLLCTQAYEVFVEDANGIDMVKVHYEVKNSLLDLQLTDFTELTLDAGTIYSGNWMLSEGIDTSGFTSPPFVIYYVIKAYDSEGDVVEMLSSSYTDDQTCTYVP